MFCRNRNQCNDGERIRDREHCYHDVRGIMDKDWCDRDRVRGIMDKDWCYDRGEVRGIMDHDWCYRDQVRGIMDREPHHNRGRKCY